MSQPMRWYYRFPGDFYAMGPTTETYANEREVRAMLRRSWGFDRLPVGTEVWPCTNEPGWLTTPEQMELFRTA